MIVTQKIHERFVLMLKYVIRTIEETEKEKDLFVFLPDFYLETCDLLSNVLVKDFVLIRDIPSVKGATEVLSSVASVMCTLCDDYRVKHIDCKKIPMNTIATLASHPSNMKILEQVDNDKSQRLVSILLTPYSERHWKAGNWVLTRFWHGSGYGYRYTNLPHHSATDANLPAAPNFSAYNIACTSSMKFQRLVRNKLLDTTSRIPEVLDSIVSELHWCFGEFLAPLQELQRAIERNEQLMMFGSMYKLCSSFFNKTIALLRVLDMFINLSPEVFLDSYYPESISLTKRIVQIVLLIIHRISSRQGCFRTVMNSRIAVLENIDYLPIISATFAVLLGILQRDLENFSETDIAVPLFSRVVLTDSSYDYDNLKSLVGSPEERHSSIMCLYDYEGDITKEELDKATKMLRMLQYYTPLISAVRLIPDDELCIICCSAANEVKFIPCGHMSCLACITYYIAKNRLCFFCKRSIYKVSKKTGFLVYSKILCRTGHLYDAEVSMVT